MPNRTFFRSAALVATFAAALVASAQTVDGKPEVKKEILDRVTFLLTRYSFVPGMDFAKWNDFLKDERAELDKAETDEEFTRDVNRALAKFNASHIVLFSPKSVNQRRTGSTVGVGITIAPGEREDGVLIVRTVKNAPADKGGLRPGDVIVTVDGKPAKGVAGIAGPAGSTVRIGYRRDSVVKEVVLIRQPFSTKRDEELAWIDRDTAKLTIWSFDMGYDGDRVESLMKKANKAKTLVLDLRDNGGGAVFNLQHLTSLLMPADTPLGTFVDKNMVRKYQKETGDETPESAEVAAWSPSKIRPLKQKRITPFAGRIVVLQNGNSGSASEIAAAALKELRGATVIGTKSAGAVLVSVITDATNGFNLQYPLSDYVTPKGQRLEGNGVTPDVEVADARFRLPKDPDPVLDRTKEWLKQLAQAEKAGQSGKGS